MQGHINDLREGRNVRIGVPQFASAVAAMGSYEVPSAVPPVSQPPCVTPHGLQFKAPPIQTRGVDDNVNASRAKSHGAPDSSFLFRDPDVRLSPAYLKPDEGVWDQTYLSKALQNMKDSEVPKLRLP